MQRTDATSGCGNPLCTCERCTCEQCSCGAASLGDLERRVMDILWRHEGHELTGRAVADDLPDHAYTTVATVLDRLTRKGLVHRRMSGRSIRFAVVGTRGAHAAVLMRKALSDGGDATGVLEHFAGSLSPDELAALRATLDALDVPAGGGPG